MTEADNDGTVKASRAHFLTTCNISVEVASSPFTKLLIKGKDIQWVDDQYAIDFGEKLIYIDAYRTSSAVRYVQEVIDFLDGKEMRLGQLDTTIWGMAFAARRNFINTPSITTSTLIGISRREPFACWACCSTSVTRPASRWSKA